MDTAIYPKELHCKEFCFYNICGGRYDEMKSVFSHGTICARILDQFASDYELVNIRILPDAGGEKQRPSGLVRHLAEGLMLCIRLDVEIVCLSAVSSVLSDSRYLFPVVRELAQKSVVLSALDNRRYVTVPTSYPFVVGVQSDWKNSLCQGELAYHKEDALFAEVYANCNIDLLKQLHCAPSNSFAVPVAAGQVNNWMNQKGDVEECFRRLKPYFMSCRQDEFRQDGKTGLREDLPLIIIYGSDSRDTRTACQMTMNKLYDRYQVQTSALCSMETEYDIRFRRMETVEFILEELLFMEEHYRTDLIFIVLKDNEKNRVFSQIDADMEIQICGLKMCMLFENEYIEDSVINMADLLNQILC